MKLATFTFLVSFGAGLLLMAVQDPLMGLGLLAWTVGCQSFRETPVG